MLVITRNSEHDMIILELPDGREIEMRVTKVTGKVSTVRVAITAPRDVKILRKELRDDIRHGDKTRN